MGQIVIRFVLGGLVVAAFSLLGDILKPKRFAGIFGAAPSVALATLGLTFAQKGGAEAAALGRSMIAGAAAFLAYSLAVSGVLDKSQLPGWLAAGAAWLVWLVVAFALWGVFLR